MSAHLCKQIYSSWRQARQSSPEPLPSPPTSNNLIGSYFPRPQSSSEKRSMDNERAEPLSRQPSNSSNSTWKWGSSR